MTPKPKQDQDHDQYRLTVYLGTGINGKAIVDRIHQHTSTDIRFRQSPMNFVRYAVLYTLDNDPSLKRKVA